LTDIPWYVGVVVRVLFPAFIMGQERVRYASPPGQPPGGALRCYRTLPSRRSRPGAGWGLGLAAAEHTRQRAAPTRGAKGRTVPLSAGGMHVLVPEMVATAPRRTQNPGSGGGAPAATMGAGGAPSVAGATLATGSPPSYATGASTADPGPIAERSLVQPYCAERIPCGRLVWVWIVPPPSYGAGGYATRPQWRSAANQSATVGRLRTRDAPDGCTGCVSVGL
jgi:hypothetical protein